MYVGPPHVTMKRLTYLLFYFYFVNICLPIATSTDGGSNTEKSAGTPGPAGAQERHAYATFNTSHDVILKSDLFSFLERRDSSSTCLLITNPEDIPPLEHGTQGYGEECELPPSTSNKCKRFVKAYDDSMVVGSTVECLKKTHLFCDPTSKKCLCSSNNMLMVQTRFQFGTDTEKNATHGRCMVRPTFDIISGFDCSPGTTSTKVTLEDNLETLTICGCLNQNETDKFNTSDPDWWHCGTGGAGAAKVYLAYGIFIFGLWSSLFL